MQPESKHQRLLALFDPRDTIYIFFFFISVFNSSVLESKLRGGIDFGPRTIKYLVSLRENMSHFCSGFMIRENFFITTGQCIVKMEKKKKPDFSQFKAVVGGTKYAIKRVNYHQNYNSRFAMMRKQYDVGLILVNQQDLKNKPCISKSKIFYKLQLSHIFSSNI